MRVFDSTAPAISRLLISADERQGLYRHAAHYKRQIKRIAKRAAEGNSYWVNKLAGQILASTSARTSSVLRTLGTEELANTTLAALLAQVEATNPQIAAHEPIRVWFKRKVGGGSRPIAAFGSCRRRYQKICADMIDAVFPVYTFEYLRSGKGPERLVLDLLSQMQRDQYDYVVTVDIRNCFGSVRKEVLNVALPLPHWAVRSIVTIDNHTQLDLQGNPRVCLAPDEAVRRGLPQGALTSQLVVSRVILGPALVTQSFADRLFLYGDNITVLARSRQEGEAILHALRSLLENIPGGPLTISQPEVCSRREAIELVKYRLRPVPARFGGGLRIGPSAKSFGQRAQRIMERSARGENRQDIDAYCAQWRRSFPLWRQNETTEQYLRTSATQAWSLGDGAEWR